MVIFILAVFSQTIYAKELSDTVKFIHISDVHYCSLNGYHPSIVNSRQHYGNIEVPLFDFFTGMPEKYGADFIAITGDMIDFHEAEAASSSNYIRGSQIEQFLNIAGESKVPLFMTLGNHDIASYTVNEEEKLTSNQYNAAESRALWIRNAGCFKNGTYYSFVTEVGNTTYRLIFLDNGYYTPSNLREGDAPNLVDQYQLLWLNNQLTISENDVEIIFMHIPLIKPDANDMKTSSNKYYLDVSDTLAVPYKPENPYRGVLNLWDVLKENGSSKLIFCGHHHSSTNSEIHFSEDYSLNQVMTGAFGRDTRNWRLVQLTENEILISHPGINEVQYTIAVD